MHAFYVKFYICVACCSRISISIGDLIIAHQPVPGCGLWHSEVRGVMLHPVGSWQKGSSRWEMLYSMDDVLVQMAQEQSNFWNGPSLIGELEGWSAKFWSGDTLKCLLIYVIKTTIMFSNVQREKKKFCFGRISF